MNKEILGIHHVTAIACDPQQNLDFYTGVLGLHLVKLTVNFDDPSAYHLYYGDGTGHPGTILTFFSWPDAPKGVRGAGQVTETAFAIPENALSYWQTRLAEYRVTYEGPSQRFGETVISISDPDGMKVELIESKSASSERAHAGGPVPLEFAIRGFHSATLLETDRQSTASLLTETMGLEAIGQEGNRFRFAAQEGGPASLVDMIESPLEKAGRVLVGSVHHIAWRTPDDRQQSEWFSELTRRKYPVSPVMDRKYFHSIYFREPGNILFEIATDAPGFAVDEPAGRLGSHLVLPAWLEPQRMELERVLPPLRLGAFQLESK